MPKTTNWPNVAKVGLGVAIEFVETAAVMLADVSKWCDIVDDHSLPKSLAGRYESRVVRTLLLVELMISQGLEVERGRVIKGMVCHRSRFCWGGRPNEPAFKVGNL